MLIGEFRTTAAICALMALCGCEALDKYLARKEHAEAQAEQAEAREMAKAEGKELRKAGPDFSVVIPEGYTDIVNEEQLAAAGAGAFGFAADERGGDGWFLSSIAFVPVPKGAPGPGDDTSCTREATGLASATGSTLVRSGIVELGGAKRCQWELVANDNPNRLATGTVMKSPSQMWVVTGNRDKRDASALPTYIDTLESWKDTE